MKDLIIPSSPFKNYGEIESLAMVCDKLVRRIQIDVCDGKYVGSTSWPFTEYVKGDFEKLGKKPDFDVYLPLWEDMNYSVDLMVEHPEKYIETFVAYGIDQFIFHFRSVEKENWENIFNLCEQYSLEFILAIDVQTPMEEAWKFVQNNLERIKGIQVMGIEKIGFQGEELDARSLDLVREIKTKFPELKVLFDGGIHEDTVLEIKKAGVDIFCIGSWLTKSEYFYDDLKDIQRMIA